MFVKFFRDQSIPYSPLNEFDPLFDENSSLVVSIERHNNYTENRETDEESDNGSDDKKGRLIITLLISWAIICASSLVMVHFSPNLTAIDNLFFIGSVSVVFLFLSAFIACV